MELDKAIKSRKSVKKFKDKKPDWRDIIECVDSARYTPTAGKNYVLRFIIIKDREKIKKISEATQQQFFSNVHYLVVICSEPRRILNSFGKRGKIYFRQQAGAAMQNFLLKIEEAGLSTCWVGHFVDEQVKRVLKIPKGVEVEAIFPIGYEYKKASPRKKIELDRILFFEEYGNKKMKTPKKIDV